MLFIYIHGFNSSPQSYKAQCFSQYLQTMQPHDEFLAPQLSDFPEQAISFLSRTIEQHVKSSQVALLGSSLGGFYATFLAQKFALKAALINPAVNPQELLLDYLGKNTNYYTNKQYELTTEHISQLLQINVERLTSPKNLMVMLQTNDEVLDYQLAESKYANSQLRIESGGDHSFINFKQHCEAIYRFLNP